MDAKIDTQGNRIYILEDCLLAKLLDETVVDPPGDIGAIFTTVGDQDFAHRLTTALG
jgi:hypothetical protein